MGLFFHSYIVPRPSKTLRLYPEKLLREFHNFGVVAKSQHIFVRFFFGNPHKDRNAMNSYNPTDKTSDKLYFLHLFGGYYT